MHQRRNESRGLYRFISFTKPISDDFKTFLKNFELNLNKILANNSFLNVVLGGFSVKSNLWCKSDKT